MVIWTRGVNVPYFDEWALVPFVLTMLAGDLTFSDIWAQHNEHRIASVRILIMILTPWTRFDVVAQMLLAFVMAVGSLLLFWHTLILTVGPTRPSMVPWLLAAISLLQFSTVQYEAWLHSLPALQWHLSTFCAAVTVWALARWPGTLKALAVSAAATLVGTMAVVSGVALWGVAVIGSLLAITPSSRKRLLIGIGLGTGALVFMMMVYMVGFERPSHYVGADSALLHPWLAVEFVASYLGALFAVQWGFRAATLVGLGGLIAALAVLPFGMRQASVVRRQVAPWVGLGAYALAVAVMTAIGRAGLGREFALSSRYSAGAALFWIAGLVVVSVLWGPWSERLGRHGRRAVVFAGCAAGVLAAALYVGAYRYGSRAIDAYHRNLALAREELLHRKTTPDGVFAYLYPPDPSVVVRYSEWLAEARLGPFASAGRSAVPLAPALPPIERSELIGYHDSVNCTGTAGWAMDQGHPKRRLSVELFENDRLLATVQAMWFRSDLASAGIGTGYHAFSYHFPAHVKDGTPRVIRARAADANVELPGSPKLIQCGVPPS
ncbi:hypothetical protein BH23ACI1_BH23ACI1_27080 [soil metagenome]